MERLRWETPATAYPSKRVGKANIFKYRCSPRNTYWAEGMKGMMYYRFAPGHNKITQLNIDGKCWMTDLPQFYWSMEHFAEQSHGHVLVAGLGLGLIVHCLVKNPKVESITVIDREPDVIKLIKPLLPDDMRVNIINDEFYHWLEQDRLQRDVVIWDLGLWHEDQRWEEREGFFEILEIADVIAEKYGESCKCFRHGIDRDPAGQALI
jgi:hypothetical protein